MRPGTPGFFLPEFFQEGPVDNPKSVAPVWYLKGPFSRWKPGSAVTRGPFTAGQGALLPSVSLFVGTNNPALPLRELSRWLARARISTRVLSRNSGARPMVGAKNRAGRRSAHIAICVLLISQGSCFVATVTGGHMWTPRPDVGTQYPAWGLKRPEWCTASWCSRCARHRHRYVLLRSRLNLPKGLLALREGGDGGLIAPRCAGLVVFPGRIPTPGPDAHARPRDRFGCGCAVIP